VRAYLAEFLADPRVVELPRWIWLPVLSLILRSRPRKTAGKYAAIWTPEGSPLAVHTLRQRTFLQKALPDTRVEYAMRYGAPRISDVLKRMEKCSSLLVVPLYPQFSRSTTESVRDCLPAGTAMVESFHDHPAYIRALEMSVRDHWRARGRGEKLVMSFHGLPQRAVDRGDPYERQCRETARRLAAALELKDADWTLAFQSRFGAARWLQPYTQPTLAALARDGARRVDVVFPGFVSDCLETLEEIGIVARAAFLAAGGVELSLVPCLNESYDWIEALAAISNRGP
jgi:ferrochelatase